MEKRTAAPAVQSAAKPGEKPTEQIDRAQEHRAQEQNRPGSGPGFPGATQSPGEKPIKQVDHAHLERLILKAQRNKDLHFDELYRYLWPHLYYYLYTLIGNEPDVQDALQQTFLVVFQKLHTIKKPRAGFAWASSIAHNVAYNHNRKATRRAMTEESLEELTEQSGNQAQQATPAATLAELKDTDTSTHPAEQAEQNEQSKIIYDHINALPEDLKEVLFLYYYSELTAKEIAVVLKENATTISSRLYRARLRLKKEMTLSEEKLRFYAASIGIANALKAQASVVVPIAPPVPWGSASNPVTTSSQQQQAEQNVNPDAKTKTPKLNLTPKQWTALGIATTLIIGVGTYAAVRALNPLNSADSTASLRAPSRNTAPADGAAGPEATASPSADDEDIVPTSPSSTEPSPQPSAEPARRGALRAPAKKQSPKKRGPVGTLSERPPKQQSPSSPAKTEGNSQTPPPPPDTLRLPGIESYLRFGSFEGAYITWVVTAKTSTTLTIKSIETLPSLEGCFTSAQSAAILSTSAGAKPTITIDANKLNFSFQGSYCYAN